MLVLFFLIKELVTKKSRSKFQSKVGILDIITIEATHLREKYFMRR